jgi:AraC-like DNA-binding protein
VSDNRKSKNSSLRDQILQYVHKNISDPDLSLETIGQEFSLSPYYVSRFFSDQNNMNIKDFIAEQRIDLAKELLLSTNLTVSEIVTQIGYLSTSSFIRKFRLSEGCTPGDYRANTVSQYKPIRE